MRPSSRTLILDAAVRLTARVGITGLTLDAAAAEAGVTKGGLMYHFPSRGDLVQAIQQHITQGWENRLLAELAQPWEEATAAERGAAYVRFAMQGQSNSADLAFMVESASHPALAQAWEALMQRWAPLPASTDPADLNLFLARLAADGFWMFTATSDNALNPEVTAALQEHMAALTGPHAAQAEEEQ